MHKVTGNWLGRIITSIVLGLIAISFAIWGIGDIFRGFGQSTVAKIGGTEISVEQFRQTFNDRVQLLGRRLGRPVTQDQARAIGFDRQLLGELLAEAAVDDNAHTLRLGLSDAEIAKRVMADPNFRGITGRFDRARFEQIIRQFGFNESRYVAEQRRLALRRQIVETISGEMKVPSAFVEVRNRFENEERRIEYIKLAAAQAGDIPAPALEALAKYFEERKFQFRAPEFRKLAILAVSPQDVAAKIEVSDSDIKRAFEEKRERYITPEKREIQQIVFATMNDARDAKQRLAQGLTFATLAAERGLKEADINLGFIEKSSIIDRAVADTAFALKAGDVSDPVQGRFGATLLRVVKVEPEKSRPFEEIAPVIKSDLALERAKTKIQDLHDKIEDARAGGLALTEVGKKLEITVRTIDAVDRSGRGSDGAPIRDLPQATELLAGVYASDIGVENDPLQVSGGFIWYDVIGVTPSRDRTLDEVKSRVEQSWRDAQIADRLKVKTAELVDKLKSQNMADVAAANGLKAETADTLKRGKETAGIPARVLIDVFRAGKGEATSTEGVTPAERFVFRVTEIVEPKLVMDAAETKKTDETLRRALGEDLLGQYITQLENDLGATINQDALRTAVGGSAN
ncbi:MAG: SurA N-terminal domain-containing protein [Rhizobiales bacterium]|nr:SurA N-terminal domain-containing protein [Hyphomicrobiales bacterium]